MTLCAIPLVIYESQDITKALPRWIEKMLQEGTRGILLVDSLKEESELDHLLWTYTPLSFLPHGCNSKDASAQDHPLWITTTLPSSCTADILILRCMPAAITPSFFKKIVLFITPEQRGDAQNFSTLFSQALWWVHTSTGWQRRTS